jgi:LysM repeat protein
MAPTLAIAAIVVVLAFVLGRVTSGGGDDGDAAVRASSAQTTTTTEEVVKHTVQSGESLLGIASQYGVTAEALAAANGIDDQNHVFVGQVLTIPPAVIEPIATTTTSTTTSAEG